MGSAVKRFQIVKQSAGGRCKDEKTYLLLISFKRFHAGLVRFSLASDRLGCDTGGFFISFFSL